jgi:hypothetical protein
LDITVLYSKIPENSDNVSGVDAVWTPFLAGIAGGTIPQVLIGKHVFW